jgi:hypothetical protein
MNEVSQINAAGSAVLSSLLYSDGAVPSAPIRIPSPVQGQSVEVLLKQAFFNPIDVGATLAFMEEGSSHCRRRMQRYLIYRRRSLRRRSLRRRNLRGRINLISKVSTEQLAV